MHWGVIMGIAIIIILLIVLLTVGGDGGNQGSGNNTPGYCKASASAEMSGRSGGIIYYSGRLDVARECSASSHEAFRLTHPNV